MRKFIILGMDGAVPYLVEEGIETGRLPHFARLRTEGFLGMNLPFPSSVTPGNWAAIATGAHPGTIGISDFSVHIPGRPFTEQTNAFTAEACLAETIWDALSRQGIRCATINYPCALPRRAKRHLAIGDTGMPTEKSDLHMIAPARCFVCGEPDPVGPYNWREHETVAFVPPAEHWRNFTENWEPIAECRVEISPVTRNELTGTFTYWLLIVRAEDGPRLIVCRDRDLMTSVAEARQGEWSHWVRQSFTVGQHRPEALIDLPKISALFRFRPIVLDPDGGNYQIYLSPVYPQTDFADPPEVSRNLAERFGPYCDVLNISKLLMGWLDPEGLLDEFRMQGVWQARAALELLQQGCAGVLTKWHAFDKFYHFFMNRIDPASPTFDPKTFEYYEQIHQRILSIADEMVGIVLDGLDQDSFVFVVSDHGLLASRRHAWVNTLLHQHGLITTREKENGSHEIVWEETKAIMHPFVQIWINLKGRDPQGCVDPEDYEHMCEHIIELLRGWKDPETNQHVMADVFHVLDGAPYGLWGERDGDVRFFCAPGYSVYRSTGVRPGGPLITPVSPPYVGDHGCGRPTLHLGRGSETGLFAGAGAGIAPIQLKRVPVRPCDIVPTICHLLEVDVPMQCEGAVLYDILA